MSTPPFRINDVIAGLTERLIPTPCRVLGFDFAGGNTWLIVLPTLKPGHENRMVDYVKRPFCLPTQLLGDAHRDGSLYVLQTRSDRGHWSSQTLASEHDEKTRARLGCHLAKRDQRYEIVAMILAVASGSNVFVPPIQLLLDPDDLRTRIKDAVIKFGVTRTTALHLTHLFWAGGSQANALLPKFDRCGLPGVRKSATTKLGRRSRRFNAGTSASVGYTLSEEDKFRLALGYSLINAQRSTRDAYLLICSRYWASHTIAPNGQLQATLHSIDQRPTIHQFRYWGHLLTNKTVADILLPPSKLRQSKAAFGGSVQDMVSLAGQAGFFDSTSSDVYLASLLNRLIKLPAMTRSLLKEVRTGLIIGFYCGWEAPSPMTALKTLLCAVSDKVEICSRFGIEIQADEWPSFLPKTIYADNGELKGSVPTEAERQFGFGLEYAPVGRGDSKGPIETQHRTDHKSLDHKLPGSTLGKQRTRGEQHAATEALWNYYEFMQALLKHIIKYNTQDEVPELAPIDMVIESPDVRPTRINIFRWLRSKNMTTEVPVDVAAFRAFTLPDHPAVLYKNGVFLKGTVIGREIRLPRIRYAGPELVATGLMSKVKQSGKVIDVIVKLDAENLEMAWLVTPRTLVPMTLQSKDSTFRKQMTMVDLLQMSATDALRRDATKDGDDQQDLDEVLWRETVTTNAKAEVKVEAKKLGGMPSKQAMKDDLRAHVDAERQLIEALDRQYKEESSEQVSASDTQVVNNIDIQRRTGLGSLMDSLNAEEF